MIFFLNSNDPSLACSSEGVREVRRIEASRLAEVAAGPERPKDTSARDEAQRAYLAQHRSTLHQGEACCVCERTVYAMERLEADKKIYHKTCFKCTACSCPLK